MEPKKTPEADIHAKRGVIFNLSLAVSLFVVVCAFKVAVIVNEPELKKPPVDVNTNEIFPPVTVHKSQVSDPGEKPRKLLASASVPIFKPVSDLANALASEDTTYNLEESNAQPGTSVTPEEPPVENVEDVFRIVEMMPVPVGGYATFSRALQKLRYPAFARRNNIEGKVFIEFTVNEKGELTDFKTLAGIGGGCDEEAIRVLKTTKWFAGKQRGKPVKVRMVQQVTFQLAK
jgi:periplasmic protein TonB